MKVMSSNKVSVMFPKPSLLLMDGNYDVPPVWSCTLNESDAYHIKWFYEG